MRFNINLASQPYQDAQRFLVRWGVALGALTLLTIVLAYEGTHALMAWRTIARQVHTFQRQIGERDQQKAAVVEFLNRAENQDTRGRSEFLNTLLARKAFSWTEVFSDLEQVMPPRLRVLNIHPEVNAEGQLELHLTVAGPVREAPIELVRRLEQSPHFTQAQINTENTQYGSGPNGTPGSEQVQYGISAIYIPKFARPEKSEAAIGVEKKAQVECEPGAAAGRTAAVSQGTKNCEQMEARNAHH